MLQLIGFFYSEFTPINVIWSLVSCRRSLSKTRLPRTRQLCFGSMIQFYQLRHPGNEFLQPDALELNRQDLVASLDLAL